MRNNEKRNTHTHTCTQNSGNKALYYLSATYRHTKKHDTPLVLNTNFSLPFLLYNSNLPSIFHLTSFHLTRCQDKTQHWIVSFAVCWWHRYDLFVRPLLIFAPIDFYVTKLPWKSQLENYPSINKANVDKYKMTMKTKHSILTWFAITARIIFQMALS